MIDEEEEEGTLDFWISDPTDITVQYNQALAVGRHMARFQFPPPEETGLPRGEWRQSDLNTVLLMPYFSLSCDETDITIYINMFVTGAVCVYYHYERIYLDRGVVPMGPAQFPTMHPWPEVQFYIPGSTHTVLRAICIFPPSLGFGLQKTELRLLF